MYAICGNIYHQYTPVLLAFVYHTWILWVMNEHFSTAYLAQLKPGKPWKAHKSDVRGTAAYCCAYHRLLGSRSWKQRLSRFRYTFNVFQSPVLPDEITRAKWEWSLFKDGERAQVGDFLAWCSLFAFQKCNWRSGGSRLSYRKLVKERVAMSGLTLSVWKMHSR